MKQFLVIVFASLLTNSFSFANSEFPLLPSTFDSGCAQNEYAVVTTKHITNTEVEISAQCVPLICSYRKSGKWPFNSMSNTWAIDLQWNQPGWASNNQIQVLKDGIVGTFERDALLNFYINNGTCKVIQYGWSHVPEL